MTNMNIEFHNESTILLIFSENKFHIDVQRSWHKIGNQIQLPTHFQYMSSCENFRLRLIFSHHSRRFSIKCKICKRIQHFDQICNEGSRHGFEPIKMVSRGGGLVDVHQVRGLVRLGRVLSLFIVRCFTVDRDYFNPPSLSHIGQGGRLQKYLGHKIFKI